MTEDLKNTYKLMILGDGTFSYCLADFLRFGEVCGQIFDFLFKCLFLPQIVS